MKLGYLNIIVDPVDPVDPDHSLWVKKCPDNTIKRNLNKTENPYSPYPRALQITIRLGPV
jgi:hypothetical protein